MFDEIDCRFNYLLEVAKNNELPTEIIQKAYDKAKLLHNYQKRKDGTPYISHPVEVAIILAELNFDEEVIAGALLHDTIEDCFYTPNQMIADFNETVFQLVDCVSAIDKSKYVFNDENIYEDPEFIKSSAEEQTFQKLIKIGKENPSGFAIKFADRLHNLRTISTFDYPKQLEKVRETEKWVLPIAKALKSGFFFKEIKNECFKIVNKENGKQYFDSYAIYHQNNKQNVDKLKATLNSFFNMSSVQTIEINPITEWEVFEKLSTIFRNNHLNKLSIGQMIQVSNYNINLVCREGSRKEIVVNMLNKLAYKTNLKIIDADTDPIIDKCFYVIEDEYKNKYNLFIMTEKEFLISKVGTLDGQNLDQIDEDNINQLESDFIKVKTRSNEVKYIATGSTVLDFAFKIHKDVGFAFKYAIVNDSKTKLPPYTKLNEGDKVEIILDKDENGKLKNNAKLRWLAYVNTEFAKKILIKYFEENLK